MSADQWCVVYAFCENTFMQYIYIYTVLHGCILYFWALRKKKCYVRSFFFFFFALLCFAMTLF